MRVTYLLLVAVLLIACVALSQAPPPPNPNAEGAALFQRECAGCHVNPAADSRAPSRDALSGRMTDAIVAALNDGAMRLQGMRLSVAERRSVAAFLTAGTNQRPATTLAAESASLCKVSPLRIPGPETPPTWNGWGGTVTNTRFQSAQQAGLTAAQVPNLKLKWAFGIDGVVQNRVQPVVSGGRLYVASEAGAVYSLDARTGCTYWIFRAEAGIRTAISVATGAVYFADAKSNAYAVDLATGRQLWIRKVEDHPSSRATGAPTLYEGRLYVPITGVGEENTASRPEYGCCTFRGSLSALDAKTGEVIWKAYSVDEPKPRGKSSTGTQLYGPAGGGIWSAPTIDARRGVVYVATGNGYADPPQPTTDAVLAFDLQTGKLKWASQVAKDNWGLGCGNGPVKNPNCPETVGPDYDFSASPILATTASGRQLIVIPQKSGMAYAMDPDKGGDLVWTYQAGKGSGIGGVWGAAVDGQQAYFAVADQRTPAPGGLHAVNLETGQRVWYTPPKAPICTSGPGCSAAQSAALTSIPGVVFSGSADGGLRGYSTKDGAVIWEFNTNREFETVNGVKAKGGSMDLGGPAVVGGMLYVDSGNGG
ncbi:MAG TPA: PQQ-binding-like beta-propeller repeat protein, partial [Terriglobia bacterium]|nr:PQQ-binding-like beta-propeller repeat protein [Terriglobia bacterium]